MLSWVLVGGSAMDVAKIASVSIPAAKNGIELTQLLGNSSLFADLDVLECIQVPYYSGVLGVK